MTAPTPPAADRPAEPGGRDQLAAWLDRLEAAAGFGPLHKVAEHQRDLGVDGDHETRIREKRVAEMCELITEAMAFREDAAGTGEGSDRG